MVARRELKPSHSSAGGLGMIMMDIEEGTCACFPEREVDLDEVFWPFCQVVLCGSVDEIRVHPVYASMGVCIERHRDMNERAEAMGATVGVPFSLSYATVWGPLTPADIELGYPEGVSYAPDEDRLYFLSLDDVFYGLAQWYRAACMSLCIPTHPWLEERRAILEKVIQRINTSIEALDLVDLFSDARIAP